MNSETSQSETGKGQHFVLHPHRSLTPPGFLILMVALGAVSFITGIAFAMIGAWPVLGFFGLDVALIYLAFKLNFRSGRLYETLDLTRDALQLTRVHPTGRRETYDFNPFWVRVRLQAGRPDGRTSLALTSHGQEVPFAQFLTDDERSELADVLIGALIAARGARI